MYIANHKYTIERMPEAYGAPKWDLIKIIDIFYFY